MTEIVHVSNSLPRPQVPRVEVVGQQRAELNVALSEPVWEGNPGGPRAVRSGLRHAQLQPYAGAAQQAARAASRDDAQELRPTVHNRPRSAEVAAAQQAAAAAYRPWDPVAGLGEQQGAPQPPDNREVAGASGRAASPGGPQPNPAAAAAYAAAAAKVTRAGEGQGASAGAWGPVDRGPPARELWAVDLEKPPRFCVACRGAHVRANEHNPDWQPYTPQDRLKNLRKLPSKFRVLLQRKKLPVALQDSKVNPVAWLVKDADGAALGPGKMSREQWLEYLPLMVEGLRECHEPDRHLATLAFQAFLATHSDLLLEAVPDVVRGLKLALNTMQASIVGHTLMMMKELLCSHPWMGVALAPFYPHLLPVLGLMKHNHTVVLLPPPSCLPPTGTFSGRGQPRNGLVRCPVCRKPCGGGNIKGVKAGAEAAEMRSLTTNATLHNAALDAAKPNVPRPGGGGRKFAKRFVLSDLVRDTLELMVEKAGVAGFTAVKSYVPTYDYFDPKD